MLLRLLIFSLVLCGWLMPTQAEDWPQWRGSNRDAKIAPGGLIESLPEQGLPRKWQVEIGAGYSGPTVSQGRVYVTDRGPQDAEGEQDAQREIERVLCFDAETGNPIWQHVYEAPYTIGYRAGPRAAVTIDERRAYSVGAMGHFNCLDAVSGDLIWQHDLASEY